MDDLRAGIRIGELSRRVGRSVAVLRAWERRYSVPEPARTEAGQRLYSAGEEERVRRMCSLVDSGYQPQVAARMLRRGEPLPDEGGTAGSGRALFDALAELDGDAANAQLDSALERYSLASVLRDIVLPLLHEIGDAWAQGRIGIAEEHFASHLVGGRLRALARGWDGGTGPRAIVACPAGERHELGAMCFALALREQGWRITWLGADVPAAGLAAAAERLMPRLVVLVAISGERLEDPGLTAIAATHPTAIGGAGATADAARRLGARLLAGDPVAAAAALTA